MQVLTQFNRFDSSPLRRFGLSLLTNLKIYPSVPDLSIDMAGAILSVPAIEFGALGDKILLIQTQFTDDYDLDGYFILLPDLESYAKILHALGLIN